MGNAVSTSETSPQALMDTSTSLTVDAESYYDNDSYVWPSTLYEEVRDMAAVSFLVYTFGYILETARRYPEEMKGVTVEQQGTMARNVTSPNKGSVSSTHLTRTFSPSEVAQIVQENLDLLSKEFPRDFIKKRETMIQSLTLLQNRADQSSQKSPLTLCEYDDKHQKHELVYGVTVNDIDKRITVVFRGTDNFLTPYSDWTTNIYVVKREVPLPEALRGKIPGVTGVQFHGGFYNYLFRETYDDSDTPEKVKFDEIMEDIKPLLQAKPGYKLYVTGHSLGGALAAMASFYFACDESIPSPVTCLNFASPRIGNHDYLKATVHLERMKKLRMCRVINKNDAIALVPISLYYHAGFQIRLYEGSTTAPEISYPLVDDSLSAKWGRTQGNSIFSNLNFGYDHSEYRERVDLHQASLEKVQLNRLYGSSLTGFLDSASQRAKAS